MQCPKCHREVSPNAHWCVNCGETDIVGGNVFGITSGGSGDLNWLGTLAVVFLIIFLVRGC